MNEIDSYISDFSIDTQDHLKRIRDLILETVPTAIETISYGMPSYKLNGKPLIYFAAFKHHIGIYATPPAHENFKERLAQYKQGKGSVQFHLNEDIPFDLIQEMVAYKANLIVGT